MRLLPPDHPERFALAEEVHARPSEALTAPSRASYVAVMIDADHRAGELAHLATLCERYGVAPPAKDVTHLRMSLGPLRVRWERHGEFSSYTFIVGELSAEPFSLPAASLLPAGWLAGLPGATVFAGHAALLSPLPERPDAAFLASQFGDNIVVGAEIGDGAGLVFTDFRIHGDGFSRFVVIDRSLSPMQAGRTLQQLFEIEAYRMMALLAFPIARRQSPRIQEIERALAALTDDIAREGGQDEALLQQLTRLAAEIESGLAAGQFRFGACRAYAELVRTRIGELREGRIAGMQTINEFMSRRFTPAVATCASVSARMHSLSERVAQASALLSTRVDIIRERQNQALLASMDRRAKQQLRLQQTVEGLSVAAITYYVAGLVGYLAKAAEAAGARVDQALVVGISIPVIAALVLVAVRRARRRISAADSADGRH